MRKSLIIPAFGLLLAVAAGGTALASSDDFRANVPQTGWMTIPQITEKLAGEGYQIRQIKMERRGYEVYAIDKDGRRVEAYVDPVNGNLLGRELGEDD